jgi:hypothetical protein
MNKTLVKVSAGRVEKAILLIRDEKVILDADLAALYGVSTKRLKEQVRRNRQRFPQDFMFELTADEQAVLTAQIEASNLRSQFATSRSHGGRRYLSYAFTEHGALMAANVLSSEVAVQASVEVVRAFIRLRRMLASNAELARKLEQIEKKYDHQFQVVFDAIRQLMIPPEPKRKEIGFYTKPAKR